MKTNTYTEGNIRCNKKSNIFALFFSKAITCAGLILCLFFSTTVFPTQVVKAEDELLPFNQQDSLALVALYYALNGPSWTDQGGWLQEGVPVPLWDGIETVEEVDGELYLIYIRMRAGRVTVPGVLPPEIGNFSRMDQFRLDGVLVKGTVPEDVKNMSVLREFRVTSGLLSGEMPWDALRHTGTMQNMRVQGNRFVTGAIPENIGDHTALASLQTRNNQFTGPIPASMGTLPNLYQLVISGNLHSGTIPDMSGASEMVRFEIFNNWQLDPWELPDWMLDWQYIERLRLDGSNLSGTIPDWITQLESLTHFFVGGGDPIGGDLADIPNMEFMPNLDRVGFQGGGNFYGEIPEWIGNTNLTRFYITYMEGVTGTIPAALGDMPLLLDLDLSGTSLTGGVPEALSQITTLNTLRLNDNPSLEIGEIPAWFENFDLERLELSGSGVTGTIPDVINYAGLERLNLSNNEIGGAIPEWMKEKVFSHLNLSYTNLEIGEFPQWIGNIPRTELVHLHLSGLGLTGTIPDWLGDFTFIRQISLADNQLTGQIPASLGDAVLLESLDLSNNQLSGTVPDNLANMGRISDEVSRLFRVDLSGNPGLTGDLPEGFMRTTFMREFRYDNTGLCAPSPEFVNWLREEMPQNSIISYLVLDDDDAGGMVDVIVTYNDEGCTHTVSTEPVDATPYAFRLYQNYPNPFNPATTIRYEIPVEQQVTLQVFNVIGQRVATLVNEQQHAGSYELNFDATGLASGTYIYRLQAGERSVTQTMMLIK